MRPILQFFCNIFNYRMYFCIFIPQTVTKPVFKGMLTMVKALIQGLELTYQNQGMGGMSSAFMVLEIIHTHFWEKDIGSSRSDTSNPSLVRLFNQFNCEKFNQINIEYQIKNKKTSHHCRLVLHLAAEKVCHL